MNRLLASAPGKLVLSGEYAVLDGATAVGAAVDCRAVVTVADCDESHHVVTAPGFSTVAGKFRGDASGIKWLEGADDYELFERVWQRSLPGVHGSKQFTLDTSTFRNAASGAKIGVGSSAALTVALATALEALGGAKAGTVAESAHRDFQHGQGSGVDIACSLNGGAIAFSPGEIAPGKLAWPGDLHYAVYCSGIAADTREKIERYAGSPPRDSRRELVAIADHCASVFACGRASDVLEALRDYCEVLRRFDDDHGLGIYDAGHAAMSDAAAALGAVYKPCGAGGGDIGIALAASAETLASFAGIAAGSGFVGLDIRIDVNGPILEEDQRP